MPRTRDPKWGSMTPGSSHLSDEWHDMTPSGPKMSEKWVDQHPSSGHMSEKWVEIEAGSTEFSDKFHEMKQSEGRGEDYFMNPSGSDRTVPAKTVDKGSASVEKRRSIQHTEFGSTREI